MPDSPMENIFFMILNFYERELDLIGSLDSPDNFIKNNIRRRN